MQIIINQINILYYLKRRIPTVHRHCFRNLSQIDD